MDELVHRLDHLTRAMIHKLQESTYEELVNFVEERQKIVDSIAQQHADCPANAAQKQEISRLLEHDHELLDRMDTLRIEAQNFLHKRGQAKMQRSAYDMHYTPDSILMDRRK